MLTSPGPHQPACRTGSGQSFLQRAVWGLMFGSAEAASKADGTDMLIHFDLSTHLRLIRANTPHVRHSNTARPGQGAPPPSRLFSAAQLHPSLPTSAVGERRHTGTLPPLKSLQCMRHFPLSPCNAHNLLNPIPLHAPSPSCSQTLEETKEVSPSNAGLGHVPSFLWAHVPLARWKGDGRDC